MIDVAYLPPGALPVILTLDYLLKHYKKIYDEKVKCIPDGCVVCDEHTRL